MELPSRSNPPEKRKQRLAWGLLLFACFTLVLRALTSLPWRYEHDFPLMHYVGLLVGDYGYVPYRDIYDPNVVGTYLIHAALVKVIGSSDLAVRCWDLLWMAGIALATYGWLGRIDRFGGLLAALLVSITYLAHGQICTLQREQLCMLFIALSLCLVNPTAGVPAAWRSFSVGLCCGVIALIKPPLVLVPLAGAAPAVLGLWLPAQQRNRRASLFSALALFLGSVAPVVCAFGWLALSGGLEPFREIASQYWPLYNQLGGDGTPRTGLIRVLYMADSAFKSLQNWLVIAAVWSLGVFALQRAQRRNVYVLALLSAAAFAYFVIPGKFWYYHRLPLQYFLLCSLCASLALWRAPVRRRLGGLAFLSVAFVTFVVSMPVLGQSLRDLSQRTRSVPTRGMPDRIATFLNANLHEGDLVQPLDWTGGALHGMLLARARLATPFLYDYYFYHHAQSAYIQGLRHRFLDTLATQRPRFVLDVLDPARRTPQDFPELYALLAGSYRVALDEPGLRIYEVNSY